MAKTIITAALTGAVTPAGYKIPETPQQIADEAYDAWKLGAAVVHLHMRADDGLGAMDKEKFRETIKLIRSHKDCDVIINCTSSGASPDVCTCTYTRLCGIAYFWILTNRFSKMRNVF